MAEWAKHRPKLKYFNGLLEHIESLKSKYVWFCSFYLASRWDLIVARQYKSVNVLLFPGQLARLSQTWRVMFTNDCGSAMRKNQHKRRALRPNTTIAGIAKMKRWGIIQTSKGKKVHGATKALRYCDSFMKLYECFLFHVLCIFSTCDIRDARPKRRQSMMRHLGKMKGKTIVLQIKGLDHKVRLCEETSCCSTEQQICYLTRNFLSKLTHELFCRLFRSAGWRRTMPESDFECEGTDKYYLWSQEEEKYRSGSTGSQTWGNFLGR